MKALTRFHVAERSLAQATTIPAVTEICGFYDGIRKSAQKLRDRNAEIEAAEFIIRARRKLGEIMKAASEAGAMAKPPGGSTKRPRKDRDKINPTLAAAGVDKNLAQAARKLGKMKPSEFKESFDRWQQSVAEGGAVSLALPEPERESIRERSAAKSQANNVSVKEWEAMPADERLEYLQPHNFPAGAHFNKQETDGIEWAQWSWNPVVGCKHDCPYCYARDITERYADIYPHKFEPAFRPFMLNAPASMKVPDEAAHDTRFKNVFTCSMADLFGRWVPAEWIEAVLDVVRNNQQWNFLFLTKFPKRMDEFEIPSNAWMGTTVDLQARVANAEAAFQRLRDHGGIRWLSIEPMLEPLKFNNLDLFNWVVIGGASRSNKTPVFHPPLPWIIDLYAQAKAAGCAVYMKTNLLGNRVLELPFDAPLKRDELAAPKSFHYLGAA